MYDKIFFTNVLRVLRDRDIMMKELSNIADVSESYLSDFGRGQANLSLKLSLIHISEPTRHA